MLMPHVWKYKVYKMLNSLLFRLSFSYFYDFTELLVQEQNIFRKREALEFLICIGILLSHNTNLIR